jgi:hypothetical protein
LWQEYLPSWPSEQALRALQRKHLKGFDGSGVAGSDGPGCVRARNHHAIAPNDPGAASHEAAVPAPDGRRQHGFKIQAGPDADLKLSAKVHSALIDVRS